MKMWIHPDNIDLDFSSDKEVDLCLPMILHEMAPERVSADSSHVFVDLSGLTDAQKGFERDAILYMWNINHPAHRCIPFYNVSVDWADSPLNSAAL
ncbi:MAG: hypothetical protein M5R41_06315 [Bacteroidia bacterium]|nr:hypothetical protein [Bacteroidia bacterium]